MIPHSEFHDILEELQRRPLAENKYRNKSGDGRSQAFGLVNKRCLPVDYSRQCWTRPKLFYHLLEYARKHVDISWNAITVNQNYQARKHRDKGNCGVSYLVSCGSYSGGELTIYEGDLSGQHNVWCNPIKADFSKIYHGVETFSGNRVSLVFYTLKTTKMPDEPLPLGTVIVENGNYLFKRGDRIIYPKEGLQHPLRGRKKVHVMEKRHGDSEVSFE